MELPHRFTSNYHYPDTVRKHVKGVLKQYRGLIPTYQEFVFNNGSREQLICLDGTIPVPYKGNTYNIPIRMWLLNMHPYAAPMCYVNPTANMHIKVSKHVDQTGRIFLPYLHEWDSNKSDLLGVIQVMIIAFGETPPLFSKPQNKPETTTAPYNPAIRPPYPIQTQPPYPTGAQPPYPVQPTAAGYNPYPHQGYLPPAMPGGAGYPPMPGGPGYPPSQPAYPPPLPSTGVNNGVMTPYPPMNGASPATSPGGTISEQHIRASLLSAVEDRVKSKLQETLSTVQAEIDVLKKTNAELVTGQQKIDDLIRRMDTDQAELESNLQLLRDRNKEMSELVERLESQGNIDVDEAVVTTAPLYKQLLQAFAEENATEDAIYYMGEALRKDVIDLDVFLKHVRELSREQFKLRALMQKCREKAALPV